MVRTFSSERFKKPIFFSGFTLVELLICIAIMVIILGITLSGEPQAISRLALADDAYQTELLVRDAQLRGSSINSLNGTYGGAGLFFNLATSTKVLKFKDSVDPSVVRAIGIGNGLYEALPTDESDSIFSLTRKNRIGKLCVATSTNAFSCNSDLSPSIKTLTISFMRPTQTAHLYVNGATTTDYTSACIQFDSIKSPTPGYVYAILVYRSGMVSKKAGTCK